MRRARRAAVEVARVGLLLHALALGARVSAQDAAPAPEPSPPPAETEQPSAVDDVDAATSATKAAAAPAPGATPADARRALLENAVRDAERAAEDSTLLPWLLAGTGVAVLATGAILSTAHVAGCEDSCSTSTLSSWLVMVGALITSGGALWLVLVERDQAEARHRVDRAREELERDRIDRAQPPAPAAMLRLRAAF